MVSQRPHRSSSSCPREHIPIRRGRKRHSGEWTISFLGVRDATLVVTHPIPVSAGLKYTRDREFFFALFR